MASGFRLLVASLRAGSIDHRFGPEHVILGLRSARASGSLVFGDEGAPRGVLVFENGMLRKARSPLAAYLGGVLYELGRIDQETLNSTLAHVAEQKQLHGAVLCARRAIGPEDVQAGLREQMERRLADIVTFPVGTPWKFHENEDWLVRFGGADWPLVDPIAGVWRGLRSGARRSLVEATLARAAGHKFVRSSAVNPERMGLDGAEVALLRAFATARLLVQENDVDASSPRPGGTNVADNLRHMLVVAGVLLVAEEAGFQTPQEGTATPRSRPVQTAPPQPSSSLGLQPKPAPEELVTPERTRDAIRALMAAGKQPQAHGAALLGVSRFDESIPLRIELAWVEANGDGCDRPEVLEMHVERFDFLCKEYPDCADAYYYRGLLFRRQGKVPFALRDLRKTLDCDSTHIEALRDLRLFNSRREQGASAPNAIGIKKPTFIGKRVG